MLKIEMLDDLEPVFDIAVDGTQNFFANGMLIHNCVEIALPTQPIVNQLTISDDQRSGQVSYEGMVQLCTLAAVNAGLFNADDPTSLKKPCDLLVRFLNELLDYQDYQVPQARRATMTYRPLGIGVINFAYLLAKNGLRYEDPNGFKLTHKLAEQLYFWSLTASVDLAKERGKLPGFDRTIYSQGKTLLDTYNPEVDKRAGQELLMAWAPLKQRIVDHGVYNATFTALMPAESSSFVSNSTNGIEPIRALVIKKTNKKMSFVQVVPEALKLKNQYQPLWTMTPEHMDGYITHAAIFQKFVCQSISTNLSYNSEHFTDGKIPLEVLINHFLLCTKLGLKTRYYLNTKGEKDHTEDQPALNTLSNPPIAEDEGDGCESGACKL